MKHCDENDESWIDEFDELLETKKVYCTMHSTTSFCDIVRMNCRGIPFRKVPKLTELYEILFEKIPETVHTHNAIIDTLMCMRCFCKYELGIYPQCVNVGLNTLYSNGEYPSL